MTIYRHPPCSYDSWRNKENWIWLLYIIFSIIHFVYLSNTIVGHVDNFPSGERRWKFYEPHLDSRRSAAYEFNNKFHWSWCIDIITKCDPRSNVTNSVNGRIRPCLFDLGMWIDSFIWWKLLNNNLSNGFILKVVSSSSWDSVEIFFNFMKNSIITL